MRKVITYGSFDLFHEGHYQLLKRAKELGDYLIVGVTTEHYDEYRGKLNVMDSLMERIENVKQTGFADDIIIEDHIGQKLEDIQKYQVDVFTVGSDWTGSFDWLKDYCEVIYLERTKNVSSTMLRAKNYKILKLGVIGSGRIARRFYPEARYVSGVNVEGVYNPRLESATAYKEAFGLKFGTDRIEEFWEQIDAVYIASPHETHAAYIRQALNNGKHVLCEKPMALSEEEAGALYALASEKGCVLMEAIKTAYCPGFQQLLGIARSGAIGAVRDVEAAFTKLESPDSRELTDLNYGGSFLELASYPLLVIIKLLGTEYQDLRFETIRDERGIDLYTKAYFRYKNSLATAKTGLGVKSEGELIISGTKGYIFVPAPWWKTQQIEVRYENPGQNEKFFYKFLGDGLRYEISDFVAAVNGNEKKEYKLRMEESVALAKVMEAWIFEERKRGEA